MLPFLQKLAKGPLPLGRGMASVKQDYQPLFICGTSGSGTTLLTKLLMQHFELGGLLVESACSSSPESVLYMKGVMYYDSLDDYRQALYLPEDLHVQTLRDACQETYQQMLADAPSPVILDKGSNSHLVRARQLKQAFPEAKFLVIFRDPVSNIEGWYRKWPKLFGPEPVEHLCEFWETLHLAFLKEIESFREDVYAISYEQFVQDPQQYLQAISTFCNLSPREALFKLKDKENIPGKGLRNISDGVIEVVTDSTAFSRQNLSPEVVKTIESRLTETHLSLCRYFGLTP
jgi:hypothetical protein